jgi:hypothetical protein
MVPKDLYKTYRVFLGITSPNVLISVSKLLIWYSISVDIRISAETLTFMFEDYVFFRSDYKNMLR